MSTPLRTNPHRNDFEEDEILSPPLRASMTEVPIPPLVAPSRRQKRLEAGRNFCFVDSRCENLGNCNEMVSTMHSS
jgi:hypothetical protein